MKMYEKLGMSTEAALKWVEDCERKSCVDCPAPRKTGYVHSAKCTAAYLLSEVPKLRKIPRWMTVKAQEDLDRLFAEFDNYCTNTFQCKKCRLNGNPDKGLADCYHLYLSELVEAPPESKGIENNLEKLQVGDEVESVISGSNGVVVDCHVPNIDGEDKYAVCFVNEIVECSRQVLAKTDKHYNTFTEYLREVRNG